MRVRARLHLLVTLLGIILLALYGVSGDIELFFIGIIFTALGLFIEYRRNRNHPKLIVIQENNRDQALYELLTDIRASKNPLPNDPSRRVHIRYWNEPKRQWIFYNISSGDFSQFEKVFGYTQDEGMASILQRQSQVFDVLTYNLEPQDWIIFETDANLKDYHKWLFERRLSIMGIPLLLLDTEATIHVCIGALILDSSLPLAQAGFDDPIARSELRSYAKYIPLLMRLSDVTTNPNDE